MNFHDGDRAVCWITRVQILAEHIRAVIGHAERTERSVIESRELRVQRGEIAFLLLGQSGFVNYFSLVAGGNGKRIVSQLRLAPEQHHSRGPAESNEIVVE